MSLRAPLALVCAAAAIFAISARLDAATATADVSAEYCVFVAGPKGVGFRFLARGVGGVWSPDGANLAIGLVDANETEPIVSGTRLIRRSGELIHELPQNELAWLDAGRLLVLDVQGVYAVAHLNGAPTRTLRAPPLTGRFYQVSVAASARLIVVAGRRNDSDEDITLVFVGADGRVVATSRGYWSQLNVVSPDGRRIAVTNDRSVAGRETAVRLRNGRGVHLAFVVASAFAWSPNSTRLAVILANTGSDLNATPATAGLYVHDVARKSSFRRIVRHRSIGGATWSPDGTRISYYADGVLFTVRAGGGTPTRIAPRAVGGTWSPDGTRISYAAGGAIFTVGAGGGTPTRITPRAGYTYPTWSPDGKLIAFTRFRTDGTSVPPCPTD